MGCIDHDDHLDEETVFKQGTLFRLPGYPFIHCRVLLLLTTATRTSQETCVQEGNVTKRLKLRQCLSCRDLREIPMRQFEVVYGSIRGHVLLESL